MTDTRPRPEPPVSTAASTSEDGWTYSEEAVPPNDPILLPSKIKGWIEVLQTCLPTDEGYDDDTEQVLGNVIRSMRKAVDA